jgi:uncharacterized membrane-anchored protein
MKRALIATGCLWLVILGGAVGIHEFTLRTGQTVLLKTQPVDPRDLFRGDYVILSYEISTLDLGTLGAGQITPTQGKDVYVTLRPEGQYHSARGIHAQRPSDGGVFLKGRVRSISGHMVRVEYGIESYFVPEGEGLVLEDAAGGSLEVSAAVDRFGNAAIKALLLDGKEVHF